MPPSSAPPKKVRLACRRCRLRRVKCDSQVPACTNCTKAGEVCIDVDSQDSSILIPRNFANAARARIQWLEDIIRKHAPEVDLDAGPRVDASTESTDREADEDTIIVGSTRSASVTSRAQPFDPDLSPHPSRKRTAEEAGDDSAFPEKAHSVAVNLGMLSLNSDSPQKHYLGSSSGVLFANLIGASPSSTRSTPRTAFTADDGTFRSTRFGWPDAQRDASEQHFKSLLAILRQELPRKDDALMLVQSYIRWVHPDHPVLDPPSLMSALEALYSCVFSDDTDLHNNGWPRATPPFLWNGRTIIVGQLEESVVSMPVVAFIFFMIFNIAAIAKVRSRIYEFSPEKFYRAAMFFSQSAFSELSLPSLQALVMLVVHSMLTPGEIKLWTLIHLALAHCVELGIHREPREQDQIDPTLGQIQRFIFFTIYSLDRSVSSIQGRPLGFRDETFDVKLPGPLPLELTGDTGFLGQFAAAVAQYSNHRYKLDQIVSDIKLHLYHLPGPSSWFPRPTNLQTHQMRIQRELLLWNETLAQETFDYAGLDSRQAQIWRLKLKVLYHTTMVLLFQPSQVIRNPSQEALQICFDNASQILQDYQQLHDLHGLHHGWRAVQNIFAAGATLIYSFWTSEYIRQRVNATEASRSLRTCSTLLTIGGEWWPSAKIGRKSFDSAADLTIQKLYTREGPAKQPRLSRSVDTSTFDESGLEMTGGYREQISEDTQTPSAALLDPMASGGEPASENAGFYDDSAWQSVQAAGEIAEQHSITFDSEIESFLADFGRSEFSWSFPLEDTDPSLIP